MWNFAKVWTFAKSYNTDSIHSPHKRYLGARNSSDLCKDNGIECHNGQGVTINTIEINYWTGYDVTVYKFGDISSSEWNWKYVTRDNGTMETRANSHANRTAHFVTEHLNNLTKAVLTNNSSYTSYELVLILFISNTNHVTLVQMRRILLEG